MDLKEELYGKQVSNTVNCFSNKLNEIAEKHSEYCLENDIDFIKNIVLVYDSNIFRYSYNKELPHFITQEIDIAFKKCMAENAPNGKIIDK